jgi:hypothetical protein
LDLGSVPDRRRCLGLEILESAIEWVEPGVERATYPVAPAEAHVLIEVGLIERRIEVLEPDGEGSLGELKVPAHLEHFSEVGVEVSVYVTRGSIP